MQQMAESAVAKYDEDLVTCALCMDIYKDPRALPCLHSFCYICLQNLVTKSEHASVNGSVRCPLCQEEHYVGNKGIAAFRQDFRIKSLIGKICTEDKLSMSSALDDSDGNSTNKCQIAPMREKIEKSVEKHCHKLQQQINDTLQARDVTERRNKETLSSITKAIEKLTKPLDRLKSIQAGILSHDHLQQKMFTAELDQMATLQEKMDALDKLAKQSESLKQLKHVESELKEIAEDINNWGFYYTCPKIVVKLPRLDDIVREKCCPYEIGNNQE